MTTWRKFFCFRSVSPVALLSLAALLLAFSGTRVIAQNENLRSAVPQDLGHLAPLPPMGWASWNHFFCDYDEKTIRAEADALVSSGMRDAGYKYVVIREYIARDRDAQGDLIVDSARFPSGMPALTAYIHKLGLKAGVYTDIGKHTCYPNPRYQGKL
jgi:alpha-galactosidase